MPGKTPCVNDYNAVNARAQCGGDLRTAGPLGDPEGRENGRFGAVVGDPLSDE